MKSDIGHIKIQPGQIKSHLAHIKSDLKHKKTFWTDLNYPWP